MERAYWRGLALGALMGAVALPVSAQTVIGGSSQPSVEVNWSVLDSLGREPNLADMLKRNVPNTPLRAQVNKPKKNVEFRPYKPGRKLAEAPVKHVAEAPRKAKAKAIPVAAKVPVEQPAPVKAAPVKAVKAEPAPEPTKPLPPKAQIAELPAPPKAELPPAASKPAGPVISLPEVPKPVAAKPEPSLAQIAKAEAAKIELPKIDAPKAEAPKPVQLAKLETPLPPPAPAASVMPAVLTPPVVVPPAPVVKAEPAPQLASLPAASGVSMKGDTLSLAFSGDSARLPDGARPELEKLVKRMEKDEGIGLQLLAYADGDDAGASKARRLSLSRALEVRKFLMEQGVRSTRIEVRALGNKLEGAGPADRVDAVVVSR